MLNIDVLFFNDWDLKVLFLFSHSIEGQCWSWTITLLLLSCLVEDAVAETDSQDRLWLYPLFLYVTHQVTSIINDKIKEGYFDLGTWITFFDLMDRSQNGATRVMSLGHRDIGYTFMKLIVIVSHDSMSLSRVMMTEPKNQTRCISLAKGSLDQACDTVIVKLGIVSLWGIYLIEYEMWCFQVLLAGCWLSPGHRMTKDTQDMFLCFPKWLWHIWLLLVIWEALGMHSIVILLKFVFGI